MRQGDPTGGIKVVNHPNGHRKIPADKRCAILTTFLDLIGSVNQVTPDEGLVVATVAHLLNSGRVRMAGSFAGSRVIVSDISPRRQRRGSSVRFNSECSFSR